MIWAVIILGRAPTKPEYVGGAIILISVVSSLIEKARFAKSAAAEGVEKEDAKAEGMELPSSIPATTSAEGDMRQGEEVGSATEKGEGVNVKCHTLLQNKYV